MKKKMLAFLLVLLMVVPDISFALENTYIFSDIQTHWAKKTIEILTNEGIIKGFPDNLAYPDKTILTGEVNSLIKRTLTDKNLEIDYYSYPEMVNYWSGKDTQYLLDRNVIKRDMFTSASQLNEPIKRITIIKMIARSLGLSKDSKEAKCALLYNDIKDISEENYKYLCLAKEYNIATGYKNNTIKYDKFATRAETFTMLLNSCKEYIKKHNYNPWKYEFLNKKSNSISKKKYTKRKPYAEYKFTLPEKGYIEDFINVDSNYRYVDEVKWKLFKNNKEVKKTNYIEGKLGFNGGNIRFKQPGKYTLISEASNWNHKNRITKYIGSITINPTIKLHFKLPKRVHTDTAVPVVLTNENLNNKIVSWKLQGNNKSITDYGISNFNNEGGILKITKVGKYTLIAKVIDLAGKEVTYSDEIEVFPVVEINTRLNTTTHTDEPVNFNTETKFADNFNILRTLSKDGSNVNIEEFIEGNINNKEASQLRFKEKGQYKIVSKITDTLNREYSVSSDIIVYPVGVIGFYLPPTSHIDTNILVETTLNKVGDNVLHWTLKKEEQDVNLEEFVDGDLNKEGGSIRFKEPGEYILRCYYNDEVNRLFEYSQSIKIYPIPSIKYSQIKKAHTDTIIDITPVTENLRNLNIVWGVENELNKQDYSAFIQGSLNNEGGQIYFKHPGNYKITSHVTDETGRKFEFTSDNFTEVYPTLSIAFDLPDYLYTDEFHNLIVEGDNNCYPITWDLSKDNSDVNISKLEGELNNTGGNIRFKEKGIYKLKANMEDVLNRIYSYSDDIEIMPIPEFEFTAPNTIHYGTDFNVNITKTIDVNNAIVNWKILDNDNIVSFNGQLNNAGGKISIPKTGELTIQAILTDKYQKEFKYERPIIVYNKTPNNPTFEINQTRQGRINNNIGEFLVNITASATDDDGDEVTLEWVGKTEDNYYPIGDNVVKVRSKDIIGEYSDWVNIEFTVANNKPTTEIKTDITRDYTAEGGFKVNISETSTDPDGDEIINTEWEGRTDNDFYSIGTHTIKCRVQDVIGEYSDWKEKTFTVNNLPPEIQLNSNITMERENGKNKVNFEKTITDPDGDSIEETEWEGRTDNDFYPLGTHTVKLRAKDNTGLWSDWKEISFEIVNRKPTIQLSHTITNNKVGNKVKVVLNTTTNDPDGDELYDIEWKNKPSDNYFTSGKHIVQARVKDILNLWSDWATTSFNINNEPPTKPTIYRSPSDNIVSPNTYITIKANGSTDPEGDSIHYEWEGRISEKAKYPVGKRLIKVRAVDSQGNKSPWTAQIFFVADPQSGGGMVLTGPDSVIIENGQPGATITKWTFTVPPVSGHNGEDYGEVSAYNKNTHNWEQIKKENTNNGVDMHGTLSANKYSKMKFYYYTSHDCMYNKSNITYSVDYYFE